MAALGDAFFIQTFTVTVAFALAFYMHRGMIQTSTKVAVSDGVPFSL